MVGSRIDTLERHSTSRVGTSAAPEPPSCPIFHSAWLLLSPRRVRHSVEVLGAIHNGSDGLVLVFGVLRRLRGCPRGWLGDRGRLRRCSR